jgi:alanyl-tRNA synthetase
VTSEQLREVAARVNAWVRADTPVEWEVTGYQEALGRGAIALFGEKYTDRVRVVTVGCSDAPASSSEPGRQCSRELCGGTHVARTGEIGSFRIASEGGVAAGVRRIEALTGVGADAWVDAQVDALRGVAARLGVPPAQAPERVDGLLAELRQRQQELDALRSQAARGSLEGLLSRVERQDGVAYLATRVDAPDAARLREMGDWLRDKLGSGVVVLGTVLNDKPQLLAMVTPDLVARGFHAGNLVKALAPVVGGGGGGRPDIAQAGGRDAGKLDEALGQVTRLLREQG